MVTRSTAVTTDVEVSAADPSSEEILADPGSREEFTKEEYEKYKIIDRYINDLTDAANETVGDKVGNPERYMQILKDLDRESPEILQGVVSVYPYINEIKDNGPNNAFTARDVLYISSILAISDVEKAVVLRNLIDLNFDRISSITVEEARNIVDSMLDGENYAAIATAYNSRYPDRHFGNDLQEAYEPAYDKVAGEYREVVEEAARIAREEARRRAEEEAADTEDEASPEDDRSERSGGIAEETPYTDPAIATFDWEENIRHPGLKKFIEMMEQYRISDPERFTAMMRSSDFALAQEKYDLMIAEIQRLTERNAHNRSSAKLEQRIELLRGILERRQEQLENYLELEESSGGNNYTDSNDHARNRLIRSINSTRATIARLESRLIVAQQREEEQGLVSTQAYEIQRQLFEKYERAGFIDRSHMPTPDTSLAERVEYIANPLVYELHNLTYEERQARILERQEEYRQRMAQEAAERQAEQDRMVDEDFRLTMEAHAADPTHPFYYRRGGVAERAGERRDQGHFKVRTPAEQYLEDHAIPDPQPGDDNYIVSPDIARGYTPEQLDFIASAGEGGASESMAVRRALAPELTEEEYIALRDRLDPEAAARDEAAAQAIIDETRPEVSQLEIERNNNILETGLRYLQGDNIEFFDNYLMRIRQDSSINPQTIETLEEQREEYNRRKLEEERELIVTQERPSFQTLASALQTEYLNLVREGGEDSEQLRMLSDMVAGLSPQEKAGLNAEFERVRARLAEGREISERGMLAFNRFSRDLSRDYSGGLAV